MHSSLHNLGCKWKPTTTFCRYATVRLWMLPFLLWAVSQQGLVLSLTGRRCLKRSALLKYRSQLNTFVAWCFLLIFLLKKLHNLPILNEKDLKSREGTEGLWNHSCWICRLLNIQNKDCGKHDGLNLAWHSPGQDTYMPLSSHGKCFISNMEKNQAPQSGQPPEG